MSQKITNHFIDHIVMLQKLSSYHAIAIAIVKVIKAVDEIISSTTKMVDTFFIHNFQIASLCICFVCLSFICMCACLCLFVGLVKCPLYFDQLSERSQVCGSSGYS